MFEVTFEGVQAWFKAEIEKIGWMIVLADSQSVEKSFKIRKLTLYLESLTELNRALIDVQGRLTEQDRINDISILRVKLFRFIEKAKMILGPLISQAGGAIKKSSKKSSEKSKK